MRNIRYLLLGLAMSLAIFGAEVATASTTLGKATFVGTIGEDSSEGFYQSRLRVRIHGTCDDDSTPQDRWITIRSGRVDSTFMHNGENMRNAYSTLMTALLSGKNVQIDGLPNCSTTETITIDLWNSQVGLF